MRCLPRFGTTCTIQKKREKHPWRGVTFSKATHFTEKRESVFGYV